MAMAMAKAMAYRGGRKKYIEDSFVPDQLLSSSSRMMTCNDIYDVLAVIVPLYVAMILAYGSVRWWKIFTPDQCSGINSFVAVFAVPVMSFHFIATSDIYHMNFNFIAADSLQKAIILTALLVWQYLSKRGALEWTITFFSLSTLPNTLVVGIPLLRAMYGDSSRSLMVQIVVLQSVIWYNLLIFLFEYRGARRLVKDQFPDTAASIASFRVDANVVSMNGEDPLQADAEIARDGKLHVTLRRSSASSMISSFKSQGLTSSRASNLTGVEIYSVQSSPRDSSFNQSDFCAMFTGKAVGERESSPIDINSMDSMSPRKTATTTTAAMGKGEDVRCVKEVEIEEGCKFPTNDRKQQMPPARVMFRLILIMVWRKLIRNPNTYSSLLGLAWSLVSYRWQVKMPAIVKGSISILSDTGIGMAMFSLGLFMALQPKIIACGKTVATFSMAVRFLTGPAVIAATSIAIGLRGDLLRIAIVQAALPLGIVPFVFAKEYDVHPDILGTVVVFGMFIALPITLLYYVLLGWI